MCIYIYNCDNNIWKFWQNVTKNGLHSYFHFLIFRLDYNKILKYAKRIDTAKPGRARSSTLFGVQHRGTNSIP